MSPHIQGFALKIVPTILMHFTIAPVNVLHMLLGFGASVVEEAGLDAGHMV